MTNSIRDLKEKIKGWWNSNFQNHSFWTDDLFLLLIILLISFGSFGLGRLSVIQEKKIPLKIENEFQMTQNTFLNDNPAINAIKKNQLATPPPIAQNKGVLVASKTGKKYHYPWCSGAQHISEANKIYFNSKEEAEAKGYAPASNCKGL